MCCSLRKLRWRPRALGRFGKHNATPNRDVACLGMAWARLPVNHKVAGAWRSRTQKILFWRPKSNALLLRARDALFLFHIASSSIFGSAPLGQWWLITSRFDVALCFLNPPNYLFRNAPIASSLSNGVLHDGGDLNNPDAYVETEKIPGQQVHLQIYAPPMCGHFDFGLPVFPHLLCAVTSIWGSGYSTFLPCALLRAGPAAVSSQPFFWSQHNVSHKVLRPRNDCEETSPAVIAHFWNDFGTAGIVHNGEFSTRIPDQGKKAGNLEMWEGRERKRTSLVSSPSLHRCDLSPSESSLENERLPTNWRSILVPVHSPLPW